MPVVQCLSVKTSLAMHILSYHRTESGFSEGNWDQLYLPLSWDCRTTDQSEFQQE